MLYDFFVFLKAAQRNRTMSAPVESLQLHHQNIALSIHSGRLCESQFYCNVFLMLQCLLLIVFSFFIFKNVIILQSFIMV